MKNRTISSAWHSYRASAIAQAITRYGGMLIGLVALDMLLRMPPAGRMLYVIPVFCLTRVAGVRLGVALAVVATIAGTVLDRAAGLTGDTWLVNALVRFAAYAIVAFKVEGMVDRIKMTTDAAHHDALTGAFNRLGFVQTAESIISQALIAGSDVTLAVIDLDDFKMVNDLYGHAYGDKMLKTLVDCLSPAVATGGIIGRTGGDEFQVLITGEPKTEVHQAIGRALNRFSDATLVQGHRSTFSYGVSGLRADGASLEPLLQCADARMYRQKGAKPHASVDTRFAVTADRRAFRSA
ncbi:MAG TPA: GGDEF domain-containing protein [Fimbriimonadaceae bacterium]|nr:GGDEF domain-containing protein [Fimbriimonadaceae bacterium]